jgi:hypothetical protein
MSVRRYTVDLQAYMAECEANYWRIMKLLSKSCDEQSYYVQLPNKKALRMTLTVTERCKYTTMVSIAQEGVDSWLLNSHFDVRIYHDAKMVEVFSYQQQGRVEGVYKYPNEKMHQKDEKFQQHLFLSECLANCLKNGFSEKQIPVL